MSMNLIFRQPKSEDQISEGLIREQIRPEQSIKRMGEKDRCLLFSMTCMGASGAYCHRLRTHCFACPARISEVEL
jgi:hypothetical protein